MSDEHLYENKENLQVYAIVWNWDVVSVMMVFKVNFKSVV